MASLFDLSRTLTKLNKDKKFGDTLKYFENNKSAFSPEEIAGNSFVVSAMLTAFRRTNEIDEAFKFIEIYNVVINKNTTEIILTLYGWLLYDKFKTEHHHNDFHEIADDLLDEEEFLDKRKKQHGDVSETIILIAEFIPLILKFDSVYSYSVFSKLFNIVPKVEKKKTDANWELINDFCDLVPLDRLKTDCKSGEIKEKGKMVKIELASDLENWYSYKSKALFELGMFKECIEISNQALEVLKKLHYSNDVWFARQIAISKKQLGNLEGAISDLLEILNKRREWFIEKELAELYNEKGDTEKALLFASQSINNFGDLEQKVDLIILLGKLLKLKNENDLSFKHFSLARLIRINKKWSIPSELSTEIDQFGKENIPIAKLNDLKKELKLFWGHFKSHSKI